MALSASLLIAEAAALLDGSLINRLLLAVAVVLAVGGFAVIGQPRVLYRRLTDRLLFGVPWGTLLVMILLVVVYGGLQDGFGASEPIVLPFRAWSYLDPAGMMVAGLAHSNTSHLLGNLLGLLVFGSLVEFLWGHHTQRRTATNVQRAWTHPVVRAVVVVPAVAVTASIAGSLVALGPIIGFSIVVFGLAGFALVQRPILTVLASLSQGVVRRLFAAFQTPEQIATSGTTYSTPWFASIALQGHAIGLLGGVIAGLAYQQLTDRSRPPAGRLWTGVLLFGIERSLWAVYWYRGNNSYVLYRAIGVGLVFLLATVVTYAVVARNQPIAPRYAAADPDSFLADLTTISGRQIGLLVVVVISAVLVGPAIATNATTAADGDLPGEPIEMQGYELTYGENVTNGQLNVIDIEGVGESTRINTSGVIVRNTDRHIWSTTVTTAELAANGDTAIRLGGLTWQETVTASRTGWQAVGGDTTYRVTLTHDNRTQPLYNTGTVKAEPVVAGQQVALDATDDGFRVGVGDSLGDLPPPNGSVQLGRLTLRRQGGRLVAVNNQTQTAVRVADKVN